MALGYFFLHENGIVCVVPSNCLSGIARVLFSSRGKGFLPAQRNPQQVGSLLFRAAVGFVVVVILAVRWSLTSRITSPPLAAGRPLRSRQCALVLCRLSNNEEINGKCCKYYY